MTLTDLITGMMKATDKQLRETSIAAVAKKYHISEDDAKFLRDWELSHRQK